MVLLLGGTKVNVIKQKKKLACRHNSYSLPYDRAAQSYPAFNALP